MKKSLLKLAALMGVSAILALAPTTISAQVKSPEKGDAAGKSSHRAVPFNGKVGSIDKTNMTFTVGKRTVEITSETKITKGGKPATFDDAVVGEEVGGSAHKAEDGKLVAVSARFGPKPEAEPKKAKKAEKKAEKKAGKAAEPTAPPATPAPTQ